MSGPRYGRLRTSSCRLCRALDFEPATELRQGIARMADAFPVVSGHELMLTTQHAGSFAAAARSGLDVALLQRELLAGAAAPALLVEHGVPAGRSQLGCIDHAHVHVFPGVDVSVGGLLSTPSFRFVRPARLRSADLQSLGTVLGEVEYVWLSDSSGDCVAIEVSASMTVPSQLARRAVAEALGLGRWDWRRSLALRGARQPASH